MAYTITSDCIGCRLCSKICPSRAISGEKKEVHRINSDVCIGCNACGRICPSGAVMDHFGLILEQVSKKDWDRPYIDLDLCISCNICLDSCPVNALSSELQKVGSRHHFPFLEDEVACIACGFCAQDCPADAITMTPRPRQRIDSPKESV